MNIQDIADFIDLVKNPAKYEKVLQNLKDEQGRLNKVIETVGKVSEIEKLKKELEAKFSSVDSDYKTKKEALEATYVAKIKKVECLQVKLEDEVKKATAAITEAEAKELSANALAASFAGRDKKLSAAEKEVAALRLELSTSLAEYNEKIAKLKAVMV